MGMKGKPYTAKNFSRSQDGFAFKRSNFEILAHIKIVNAHHSFFGFQGVWSFLPGSFMLAKRESHHCQTQEDKQAAHEQR
jgi:hypothetical protein